MTEVVDPPGPNLHAEWCVKGPVSHPDRPYADWIGLYLKAWSGCLTARVLWLYKRQARPSARPEGVFLLHRYVVLASHKKY